MIFGKKREKWESLELDSLFAKLYENWMKKIPEKYHAEINSWCFQWRKIGRGDVLK